MYDNTYMKVELNLPWLCPRQIIKYVIMNYEQIE